MKKCFECETTEDLQEHHVVPRSRGGTKTVTLCYECHMKVHGRNGKGTNHSRLTKEGLQRTRERGVKLGSANPKTRAAIVALGEETDARVGAWIREAQSKGITSQRKIAAYLNELGIAPPRGDRWSKTTIRMILRRMENK
jgi:hypothetical protein